MSAPAWRFDGDYLNLEERCGYRRAVWPAARAAMGMKPGMRVLDVGCGAGAFTRFVAEALEGRGAVVGVDHDEDLLAKARASTPARDGLEVEFRRADALKLDFPDASFDAVVSGFLLCILPSPLDALREMRRVTKPGGLIASLSCFCKSGNFPMFGGVHEMPGIERYNDLRVRFADTRRVHVRNPALGLPNGKDLDVWGDYARAGLVDLRIDGFLTMFAPGDARWSAADAREYVEGRGRIEREMMERLSDADVAKLERGGFSRAELAELRALTAQKYAWLLADDARIRRGMEVLADPSVLITGRVPAR